MLTKEFFKRKTVTVAMELVGKKIVRKYDDGRKNEFIITETEAYVGPHDLACHSSKGKTERTLTMYEDAGTIYVYLIYGMYYMFNVVTEEKGFPSAVLIRGVRGIDGPGKVTRSTMIDKKLNGKMLSKKSGLWIEEGEAIPSRNISRTPRIGVAYAGERWANEKLRFVLKEKKQYK